MFLNTFTKQHINGTTTVLVKLLLCTVSMNNRIKHSTTSCCYWLITITTIIDNHKYMVTNMNALTEKRGKRENRIQTSNSSTS